MVKAWPILLLAAWRDRHGSIGDTNAEPTSTKP